MSDFKLNSGVELTDKVDLSKHRPPFVFQPEDPEKIYNDMKKDFESRMRLQFPAYVLKESDPAAKLLQTAAFNSVLNLQKINDSMKQVYVSHAEGKALDELAKFFGIDTREDGESDDQLRNRMLLSYDSFSTAGTRDSYKYHAFKVSEANKLGLFSIKAYTKKPGHVGITCMFPHQFNLKLESKEREKLGEKTEIIKEYLNRDDIRPLNEMLTVELCQPVKKSIDVKITVVSESFKDEVKLVAEEAFKNYARECFKIGEDITISSLHACLTVPNVVKVTLSISEDIKIENNQTPILTIGKLEVVSNKGVRNE